MYNGDGLGDKMRGNRGEVIGGISFWIVRSKKESMETTSYSNL
jgi:hypothetical protein